MSLDELSTEDEKGNNDEESEMEQMDNAEEFGEELVQSVEAYFKDMDEDPDSSVNIEEGTIMADIEEFRDNTAALIAQVGGVLSDN